MIKIYNMVSNEIKMNNPRVKKIWNNLSDYNNLAKGVNKDLEEKKHFVFFKRECALDWLKETRERINKIKSWYF